MQNQVTQKQEGKQHKAPPKPKWEKLPSILNFQISDINEIPHYLTSNNYEILAKSAVNQKKKGCNQAELPKNDR